MPLYMDRVDGVLLGDILKQKTSPPPPTNQEPVATPAPIKRVHFANDVDDDITEESDDQLVAGGLIKKNNIYINMLENIKPAIIAGIVVALFQIDMVKSFVSTNISGVFSPDLSVYGFFVFIVIGAIMFWIGHLMSRTDQD